MIGIKYISPLKIFQDGLIVHTQGDHKEPEGLIVNELSALSPTFRPGLFLNLK